MAQPTDNLRRRLEDLRVLHTVLEPDLRDIYTEARSDVGLLKWYFQQVGVSVSGIYAVDDRVLVDTQIVLEAGGEVGPRGRVIALAAAVAGWGLEVPAVTCVIDADRDRVFAGPEYPDLFKTDSGSFEAYAFAPRPLQQFLDLVLMRDTDAEHLIEAFTPALNDLFLTRAVLHIYGPHVPLIQRFTACCSVQSDQWVVDCEELIVRSLAVASVGGQRGHLIQKLEEARARLPTDRRRAIRGHDIAPMLVKALNLTNEWGRPEVVEHAWRGCMRIEDLEDSPMFKSLRSRLT